MAFRPFTARLSSYPWVRHLYKVVKPLPIVGRVARGLVPVVLPGGTRLWIQVPSGPGKGLWLNIDPFYEDPYLDGEYEQPVQRLLARYLKPGATLYDVGGHIGFVSMIAARLVGKAGQVFAFEADPENAAKIREHLQRNSLKEVQIVPFAVWSECGHVAFSPAPRSSGRAIGKVVPASSSHAPKTEIEVPAITLDSFAKDHKAPRLIKIDVEGGEIQVLEGAGNVFDDAKPILICEVHDQKAATWVEGWLKQRSYVLEWLTDDIPFPRHLLALPAGAA